MRKTTAVILAGGKGTRLGHLTQHIPKPMLPINNTPLIEHHLLACKKHGVTDVIITISHHGDIIQHFIDERHSFGLNISFFHETTALGTAGAFPELDLPSGSCVLVIYGDIYMNLDIHRFLEFHAIQGADATLATHPNDHPYDSDLIRVNAQHQITEFLSKPHQDHAMRPNLVNAGAYVINCELLTSIPKNEPSDFGKDIFPTWTTTYKLYSYLTCEYMKDMGTPERYQAVENDVKNKKDAHLAFANQKPAIFIDRDGVINDHHNNYVTSPDEFHVFPDVPLAIRAINNSHYLNFLVTNQPVIARNMCSYDDVFRIHEKLDTILGESHAKIDDKFICPHHPDNGFPEENKQYKMACDCRKPHPGMLLEAQQKHGIDLSASFIIGDSFRDIEAGQSVGVTPLGLRQGSGCKDRPCSPDLMFDNLSSAVDWILNSQHHAQAILHQINARLSETNPPIIVIGGQSRSGKSTLAKTIEHHFRKKQKNVHAIHLDQWILPSHKRTNGMTVMDRFQSEVIHQELTGYLHKNNTLTRDHYDALRTQVLHQSSLRYSDADLVIIDGVVALLLPVIQSHPNAYRLFVDISKKDQRTGFQSYYHWRSPDLSVDDIEALYQSRQADEWDIVEDSKSHAHMIYNYKREVEK